MKNKTLFWTIITFLSLGAINLLYTAANSISITHNDYPETLYAVSIFILGISFLLQVFNFIRKPQETKVWQEKLNTPISDLLKIKVPWWLIIYFIIVLALVVYGEYADRL